MIFESMFFMLRSSEPTVMISLQMFSWAEQAQHHSEGKSVLTTALQRKLSRHQFALVIALYDEAENMYMSSGRSMRHVLLDPDFNSKSMRDALLRECARVSLMT